MECSIRSTLHLVAHRFRFEFVTRRCRFRATKFFPMTPLVLHRAPATHTNLQPPTPGRSEKVFPDCLMPHTPDSRVPGMKLSVLRSTAGEAYRVHRL